MAKLVWSESAQFELDAIVDFIALDNKRAAFNYGRKVLSELKFLNEFPELGKRLEEIPNRSDLRELVIPPCRVFYRYVDDEVHILHIMRSERKLRLRNLER